MRKTNEELNECAKRIRAKFGGGVTVEECVQSYFWEHRAKPEIEVTYQIIVLAFDFNTGPVATLEEAEARAINAATRNGIETRAADLERQAAALHAKLQPV